MVLKVNGFGIIMTTKQCLFGAAGHQMPNRSNQFAKNLRIGALKNPEFWTLDMICWHSSKHCITPRLLVCGFGSVLSGILLVSIKSPWKSETEIKQGRRRNFLKGWEEEEKEDLLTNKKWLLPKFVSWEEQHCGKLSQNKLKLINLKKFA